MTPLQIEIAAYTLGVRIALFSVPGGGRKDHTQTVGKVDEYGRLVPSDDVLGHYFGPKDARSFLHVWRKTALLITVLFPKHKLSGTAAAELNLLLTVRLCKNSRDIGRILRAECNLLIKGYKR